MLLEIRRKESDLVCGSGKASKMNRIWLGDAHEVNVPVRGNVLPKDLCDGRDLRPEWLEHRVPLESGEIGRACGPRRFLVLP